MKYLALFCMFLVLFSCSKQELNKLDFMLGVWKIEGKEQFESWQKKSHEEFEGLVYKVHEGKKIVLETLRIYTEGERIIYEATVSNQNDGSSIPFILNESIESFFSFENDSHDFPKKIQYKKLTEDKLKVFVKGENGQGFSLILNRID